MVDRQYSSVIWNHKLENFDYGVPEFDDCIFCFLNANNFKLECYVD